MTLNVNEIKEDCESKYLVLQDNTTTSVTFVTDDKKVPKIAKKGFEFFMREFQIRTNDGLIKTLALFNTDAKSLIEIVAKSKGINYEDVTTLIDLKVQIIKNLDDEDNQELDFRVMA